MLAAKSPYPTPSLGGGPSQATSQYNATMTNYRSHTSAARADQTMFESPTESEFSEIYDAPDAVRYAALWARRATTALTPTGIGTKTG
jgi:mitogen-activated protein kinase kinase kinase